MPLRRLAGSNRARPDRVVMRDVQALERFIVDFLSRVSGVDNIQSLFALKQVKYKTSLPLPQATPAETRSNRRAR